MKFEGVIVAVGGAGYVGSHTVKLLTREALALSSTGGDGQCRVVVVDSLESGHAEALPEGVELVKLRLDDRDALVALFRRLRPVAVIDFAAYLNVGESQACAEEYMRNNVANFKNLLLACAAGGTRLVVKSSTIATYGDIRDEDCPVAENFNAGDQFAQPQMQAGTLRGEALSGQELFSKLMGEYCALAAPDRPADGEQQQQGDAGMAAATSLESAGSKAQVGTAAEAALDMLDLRLNERDVARLHTPCSVYGWTKLLNEIMLSKMEAFNGTRWVALRYGNVCGADPDGAIGEAKPKPHTLMTLAIYSLLANMGKMPLDRYGVRAVLKVLGDDYPTRDGTCVRDYVHPTDLATAHIAALQRLDAGGQSAAYNLGTQTGSTVLEVLKACEMAAGHKLQFTVEGRRPGDAAQSVLDCSLAAEELGYKTEYDLARMAETAWAWHKEHIDGFQTLLLEGHRQVSPVPVTRTVPANTPAPYRARVCLPF